MIQKAVTQAPPTAAPAEPRTVGAGIMSLQNVTTGLIALAGAFGVGTVARWLWLTFVRPAIDSLVFAALRRRREEVEAHLRNEVFKDDIAARKARDHEIAEAVRIATEAAATVEIIRIAHDEINEKLERVVPICEQFGRMEKTLEKIETRGAATAQAMDRVLGRLDERDRWDGIFRRSTDPPNTTR